MIASYRDKLSGDNIGFSLRRFMLHTQYRSSLQGAKIGRRQKTVHKQYQKSGPAKKQVEGPYESDDCSTTSSCWGRAETRWGSILAGRRVDAFFDIDVFMTGWMRPNLLYWL
jgi:hypothetical protein